MFITQAKEILEAVPTARFGEKEAAKLLYYVEEEEQSMLEPLIGDSLMELLYCQYKVLVEHYGSITAPLLSLQDGANDGMDDVTYTAPGGEEEHTLTVYQQQKTIRLLRTIQSALVYRMLSNKLYTLSTSLNLGGGANRASAGDYEPADDKHMQAVCREYFMNSRRAEDNILILLEKDAKECHRKGTSTISDSLWLTLWQESDGYYLKEDLLFPTLRSLKPYYPCNEPTKFLSIAPTIRYCQDTYISPRVDATLFTALLGVSNNLSADQRQLQKQLRTALAYYVKAKEAPREERNEALMTADAAMSTALSFISKTESLQVSSDETQTAYEEDKKECACACSKERKEVNANEYHTFSMLFAPGVNRW